jgi:Zn-dependent M16 (insulinase) family peptidase
MQVHEKGYVIITFPKSDLSSLFHSHLQRVLHPGTTYSHESGGDPNNITDLTYQQLKDFHALFYHPTNAKFLSYGVCLTSNKFLDSINLCLLGDADLSDHLHTVNDYISGYDVCKHDFTLHDVTQIQPNVFKKTCPLDPC